MYCILSGTKDPCLNLAVEEFLLKNSKEEYLILSINDTSVIVGKHQPVHREINTKYVTEHGIPVIRRITGGGTVFHDAGNLNYTFISQVEEGKQIDFRKHTKPVIDFLHSAGIDARLEGKSDIKVDSLKISGNAEHVFRNRVLHHGTLLFSASMETLRGSIRKDYSSYLSRGVNSNPSPVANLSEMLPGFNGINEFRERIMEWFIDYFSGLEVVALNESELAAAKELAASKYNTWEWNYAYGPEYNFTNSFLYKGSMVNCRLYVKEGTIRDCIAEGHSELAKISDLLTGTRHMPGDIKGCLEAAGIDIDVFSFF
jgi:lipoate-protein ligase A